MIWNDSVLFIHAPKTAGMSMTALLSAHLKGTVKITGPYEKQHRKNNIVHIPGKRHETLIEAASSLIYRNVPLERFEKIFVVMRNPYALELSRFSYLRQNLPQDRGIAQDIALEGDFRKYLERAPFFGMTPPRLDLYYHINGSMPDNLVILRYEHLADAIERSIAPFLTSGYQLPHENQSVHDSVAEIYDAEMEELCYQRHRWFFDKSFYSRSCF